MIKADRRNILVLLTVFGICCNINPVHATSPFCSFLRKFSPNSDGGWFFAGWLWGADSIVTIADRTPSVNFPSRPASFGPSFELSVMGYGIPMNAFTAPCPKDLLRGSNYSESLVHGSPIIAGELSRSQKPPPSGTGANDGCPELCAFGDHIPAASESWIAIVQRGKCSFVSKVREAQRFGARAVVVGGDDPSVSGNSNALLTMYSQGDASDIEIPSTFIKFSHYTLLTDTIAKSNTSTSGIRTIPLRISVDFASWEWYSPILSFVVLLLLPSLLTLITLLIHRIRAARAARRERAPEDVVNSLPWMFWTGPGWEKQGFTHTTNQPLSLQAKSPSDVVDLEHGDVDADQVRQDLRASPEGPAPDCATAGDESESPTNYPSTSHGEIEIVTHPWFAVQTECIICLSDFENGDRVRILPCKHIFHLDEVDEWLIHRKKLCPICKADVTQIHAVDPTAVPSTTVRSEPTHLISASERTPLLPTRSPIREGSHDG